MSAGLARHKKDKVYMKERLMKKVVTLLLVAVTVAAGVFASLPGVSQAASGTTYTVVLQSGSATVSIVSINDGASVPQTGKLDGTTFKLIVDSKLKTEKVKSTGGTASYYPVTLLAKSYSSPKAEYPIIGGGGTAVKSSYLKGDAKGKLYTSGGDVDYSVVQGEKKAAYKYGDGKADPNGSLFLPLNLVSSITAKETGKKMMDVLQVVNLTTGTCSLIAQGVKGGVNGKGLPANDTTKLLPNPFTGVPIDLNAGTGTVIAASGAMNGANKMVNGTVDNITGQVWVMKISK